MSILWIDFETRSLCDLTKHGTYIYAKDPSTEILCMSYAFDDGNVVTWDPLTSDFPPEVDKFTGQIRAHNATFERLIFKYVLGTRFADDQFYCTSVQARANCMPGALGDAGRFAGTGMEKDFRGTSLIRQLSIPRPDGSFNEDPKLMREMFAYCEQDVLVMRALSKNIRELTEEELYDYHVNERINDIGVMVDKDLCSAAESYIKQEAKEIEALVYDITGGKVKSTRSKTMKDWVYNHLPEIAQQMMETDDGKVTINKATRSNILNLVEEQPWLIAPEVADVIQCADDIWSSSTAKFKKIKYLADSDNRVRGSFVFCGGIATGRASSYGIQVHNLPRKCAQNPDKVRDMLVRGDTIDDVNGVLKSMLRPTFVAKRGHKLIIADWSAIEGRVNPWLSKTKSGLDKLDQYREGLDPYKVNAATLYGVPYNKVTKDQRQVGKIQELALGYMGGVNSLSGFAKIYKVQMDDAQMKKAVDTWRGVNRWAFQHGAVLEDAYMRAMRNPGTAFPAACTEYYFDGVHLWYTLPSGRELCYPFAEVRGGDVYYAKASKKPKADDVEWPMWKLWPGLAIENLTQGAANDILRYALRELDDLYYSIVLHVHDEIVLEVPDDQVEQASKDIVEIMTTSPEWAKGLPLEVPAPDILTRYFKPE
jgi:DNA polymerase bacteriophage-type